MNFRIRPLIAIGTVAALATLAACSNDDTAEETTTTAAAVETTAAPATTAKKAAHWTYEGEEGPENWGRLDPAYVTCADGSAQTPIDIAAPTDADLANPVISTVETVGATGLAVMAIVVPVLCFVAVVALLIWAARKAGRLLFGRSDPSPRQPTTD